MLESKHPPIMSQRIFLSLLAIAFIQWSCGPCEGCSAMTEKEEALAEREAALDEREAALEEREAAIAEWKVEEVPAEEEETGEKEALEHPIRLGSHRLTLQWISWEDPGTAEVSYEGDNRYRIVGEQRSVDNDDYLTINGTLTPKDERTFIFDGTIAYQVSHNNGGEVCVKEGPLHFRASGQRQYWRLQEKTNCEGGMVTDYVDIYF